jgi:hypothetical protein
MTLVMSAPTAGLEFCQNWKPQDAHTKRGDDDPSGPTAPYGLPQTGQKE